MPEKRFEAGTTFQVAEASGVRFVVTLSKDLPLSQDIELLPVVKNDKSLVLSEPYSLSVSVPRSSIDAGRTRVRFEQEDAYLSLQTDKLDIAVQAEAMTSIAAFPKAGAVQPITLAPQTVITSEFGYAVVPAGTEFEIALDRGLAITLARTARLRLIPPIRQMSEIEVDEPARALPGSKVNLRVTLADFDFRAGAVEICFQDQSLPGRPYVPGAGIEFLKQVGDTGYFAATIPADIDPTLEWHSWREYMLSFGTPASVLAIASAGDIVRLDARTSFVIAHWSFAVVAVVVLALALIFVTRHFASINPRKSGLWMQLLERDGRISLSNLQTLLWTGLILFSMAYVWSMSGRLLPMKEGILILLGIASGTSVLARNIEGRNSPPSTMGASVATDLPDGPLPLNSGSLLNKDDESYLLRFQMLGFTVFTWFYVLIEIIRQHNFPDLPESLYALMGISNGTYLGGKWVAGGDDRGQSASQLGGELSVDEIKRLQARLGIKPTGTPDVQTRVAAKQYKTTNGLIPDDDTLTKALLYKLEAEGAAQ